ncbi:MAG: argininosuccinate synthase [Deltaproteobacteria bacterium]|nr:MAG: argininosuccinate synthase [Deltaproteobacteria bacterium]
MARPSPRKIVLAYSGGLDTSVILKWLIEERGAAVVAFCADLGQGEELEPLAEKAAATGAVAYEQRDVREEFVRDFVFPALRAAAVYEGTYLLGTALARPLIARHLVEIAHQYGCDAIAHGATGKGNDQVRFELAAAYLDPSLTVVAPWREWSFQGREEITAYAQAHGIPLPTSKERPWSTDRNLLHLSFEGGILEDPWVEPPEEMFVLTTAPERAPEKPEYVEIEFERGDPVAVDGERLSPAALLERLNTLAGRHGVGRVDMVENRFVGIKSRGVYETPGGTVLHAARRAVESITLDREALHLRDEVAPRYATLVYNGFWYAPEREALQALVDEVCEAVSGVARLKLYKGACQVVGRRSDRSLYDPALATFEADTVYDPRDAAGFIRIESLRLRARARRGGGPAAGGRTSRDGAAG